MKLAGRMQRLGTEGAFEVLAKARKLEAQGKHIVHLEIGEPDFATPDHITEAAVSALQGGWTHYTPAAGIPEARASVAAFVGRRLGVEVAPDEVVLVPGSKNVLHFVLLSLIEPGDEVIYPDPGYPVYSSLINFVGAKQVPIRLREERNFRLDPEELTSLVTDRTRMIILNTPQNPTGGVLTKEDVQFVARLAVERDLFVVADEIYSQITYGFEHASILAEPGMKERTVLMDGMSKAYAMCGWRLGYGVAPQELAVQMERLMINTSSCAAAFTQMAAIEAFDSPQSEQSVRRMVEEFRRRRDIVVDGLNDMPGVRCQRPEGAFYAFPNIEGTGLDERNLAAALLEEAGVAVLPGTAFGPAGRGFIRLAYTQGEEDLRLGLERMSSYLAGQRAGTTGSVERAR
ncbi:MAG: pyridoxal phosphate-dependent aminotransferase [Candidatus Dormibacteraeota bacterium]|uniref:Aminotransferase n=1 Tax=Candidatus Dormiibacter inghamiae TaxID=3127013 RepID=A0A934KBX6_9BACT|nr:pyridoxal phosphate-dependent aminotransferase [Candidatus Dormibacteraeota bacterium]MBJ7604819.1 pyridoxal phosphate-dependent aminotransferase [Candidatus Dormibacteraeota bacterium]